MDSREVPYRFETPYGLAVRVLLRNRDGEVLLLRRSSRSKTNPGRWELPGGKLDDRERFDDALRREVLEETGLEIGLGGPVGVADQRLPEIRVVHLVMEGTVTGGALRLSSEHSAGAWVAPARFGELELANWFRDCIDRSPGPFRSTGGEAPA